MFKAFSALEKSTKIMVALAVLTLVGAAYVLNTAQAETGEMEMGVYLYDKNGNLINKVQTLPQYAIYIKAGQLMSWDEVTDIEIFVRVTATGPDDISAKITGVTSDFGNDIFGTLPTATQVAQAGGTYTEWVSNMIDLETWMGSTVDANPSTTITVEGCYDDVVAGPQCKTTISDPYVIPLHQPYEAMFDVTVGAYTYTI